MDQNSFVILAYGLTFSSLGLFLGGIVLMARRVKRRLKRLETLRP